jgi:hypothetical protein
VLRASGLTDAALGLSPAGAGVRDGLAYYFNPNKRGDDSAARFGRTVFAQLPLAALIYALDPGDTEALVVLRYFQTIERLRPDVRVESLVFLPDRAVQETMLAQARSLAGCRPLFVASLNPAAYPFAALRAEFDIAPEAGVYRLAPRRAGAIPGPCPAVLDDGAALPAYQLIRNALQ